MNKKILLVFLFMFTLLSSINADAAIRKNKKFSGTHMGIAGGYTYIDDGYIIDDFRIDSVNSGNFAGELGYMINIFNFILEPYITVGYTAAKDNILITSQKHGNYQYRTYGDYGINFRLGFNIVGFMPYALIGVSGSPFVLQDYNNHSYDAVSVTLNYGAGFMYQLKNKTYFSVEFLLHSDIYTNLYDLPANLPSEDSGLFYFDIKVGGGIIF